jgi:fatty-acyl-CoA synthase
MNDLHRPQFLPDLLIAALERGGDRPCLVIGDRVLTAHEMRNEISRYVQAYRARGIAGGDGIATLSKNRPEVLCSMGATMVSACRSTPLHPLGSLDDHAYVLDDAGIETLIFDPGHRRRARQRPGQPCPRGPGPHGRVRGGQRTVPGIGRRAGHRAGHIGARRVRPQP